MCNLCKRQAKRIHTQSELVMVQLIEMKQKNVSPRPLRSQRSRISGARFRKIITERSKKNCYIAAINLILPYDCCSNSSTMEQSAMHHMHTKHLLLIKVKHVYFTFRKDECLHVLSFESGLTNT